MATPLFKLRPETMPDDFLAGVEIDGAGSAESAGAVESAGAADSDGAALEAATGASWAGTEGITPSWPVS